MWISLQTIFSIISLATLTLGSPLFNQQIQNSVEDSSHSMDYITEELDKLKSLFRSRAPSINSITQLNITIDAKRRLLKNYRAKLQELNELDTEAERSVDQVHERSFHSYSSIPSGANPGSYKFPVGISHPDDHRKETKVQSATLKLFKNPNISLSDTLTAAEEARNVGHNVVLLIYQSLPDNMRRLVTSSVISLSNTDPVEVDITEIAQTWIDEPDMNYGIEIECPNYNISRILQSYVEQSSDTEDQTLSSLNIFTYERTINTARRQRRDIEEELCQPGKCCRQPVNITLAEIGHHIDGFHLEGAYMTAYLCSGRCPRNYKLHNKWSNIKNIIRTNNRDTELRNRCAPTAYETYRMVNIDVETDLLSFTEYDDLLVAQCGCV